MVITILIIPATWRMGWDRNHEERITRFLQKQNEEDKVAPDSLILKYSGHPLVQFTHILPGFIWAVAIPYQFYPSNRIRHPKVHARLGYVFAFVSVIMMVGVSIIDSRKMHLFNEIDDEKETSNSDGFTNNINFKVKKEISLYFMAIYFLYTIIAAIMAARHKHFERHNIFIIRHVSSGIWVSLQRIMVFMSQLNPAELSMSEKIRNFYDFAVYSQIITVGIAEAYIYFKFHNSRVGEGNKKLMQIELTKKEE